MANPAPTSASTEVSPFPEIVSQVETGQIVNMADLVTAVAPAPVVSTQAAHLPSIAGLTKSEREALKRLPEVYGSVVPSTRRMLDPSELSKLLVERGTLKTVAKAIDRRCEDISLTLLNHNDVAWERKVKDGGVVMVDRAGKPLTNKDGHIVRKAKLSGDDPTIGSHFSLETRAGTPAVDVDKLASLADDPETDYIDHADYLAMTRPGRTFDENAAMLYLRSHPGLLRAISEAAITGIPVVSVYQRERR